MILCEIFKQKHFPRIIFQKVLQNFQEISVVEFIFRKASRVRSLILLKIDSFLVIIPKVLKIFRAAISWTSTGSYFLYYVMERFFLSVKRVFICIYFNGNTRRSLLKVCFIMFHQGYILLPNVYAYTNCIFFN